MESHKLPKIQDLYADVELAKSNDTLMALLNQPPKQDWVKLHPFINNYKYLPIDKIEFLLKKIFKKYRIEIIREGIAFNGVYVVVRVHYLNPITNEFDYHDGIGAKELQVKKGASAADLAMINSGALAMAFPIAKTVAIKDACDHFGSLFGSDLNRKDVMSVAQDETLQSMNSGIEKFKNSIQEPEPITKSEQEHTEFEVIEPETVSAPNAPAGPEIPAPFDENDF